MPSISLNLHIIIIPNYKYLTLLGSSHRIASQLFCIFFSFTFFLRRDRVELVAPNTPWCPLNFFFYFFLWPARTKLSSVYFLYYFILRVRAYPGIFSKKWYTVYFLTMRCGGQLKFFFRSNRQLNFFLEYLHFLGTERRTSSKYLNMTRIIISLNHTHFRFEYLTGVSLNIQELVWSASEATVHNCVHSSGSHSPWNIVEVYGLVTVGSKVHMRLPVIVHSPVLVHRFNIVRS